MGLHIGWPQGIFLGFMAFKAAAATHKFAATLPPALNITSTAVVFCGEFALLYWGGFFG